MQKRFSIAQPWAYETKKFIRKHPMVRGLTGRGVPIGVIGLIGIWLDEEWFTFWVMLAVVGIGSVVVTTILDRLPEEEVTETNS